MVGLRLSDIRQMSCGLILLFGSLDQIGEARIRKKYDSVNLKPNTRDRKQTLRRHGESRPDESDKYVPAIGSLRAVVVISAFENEAEALGHESVCVASPQ